MDTDNNNRRATDRPREQIRHWGRLVLFIAIVLVWLALLINSLMGWWP